MKNKSKVAQNKEKAKKRAKKRAEKRATEKRLAQEKRLLNPKEKKDFLQEIEIELIHREGESREMAITRIYMEDQERLQRKVERFVEERGWDPEFAKIENRGYFKKMLDKEFGKNTHLDVPVPPRRSFQPAFGYWTPPGESPDC